MSDVFMGIDPSSKTETSNQNSDAESYEEHVSNLAKAVKHALSQHSLKSIRVGINIRIASEDVLGELLGIFSEKELQDAGLKCICFSDKVPPHFGVEKIGEDKPNFWGQENFETIVV